MGVYLSTANREVEMDEGSGLGFKYAAGGVQGWRKAMEGMPAAPSLLAHSGPKPYSFWTPLLVTRHPHSRALPPFAPPLPDAHIAECDLSHAVTVSLGSSSKMSLFAVFDGHGGKEVAKFCERRFCEEFVLLPQFRSGDYSEALRTCFHKVAIHAVISPPPDALTQPSNPHSRRHVFATHHHHHDTCP